MLKFFFKFFLVTFGFSYILQAYYPAFSNSLIYNFKSRLNEFYLYFFLSESFHSDESDPTLHLNEVITSLKKLGDKKLPPYKVAVGFGSCVDIFGDALPVLSATNVSPQAPIHHDRIDDEKELAECFSYFFEQGAAGERYVASKDLFEGLVKNTYKGNLNKVALGGNAPVMANRFALEQAEAEILLAAQESHEFKEWMNPRVVFSGPITNHADRHLILEYKKNEKFGNLRNHRDNRFIVHSDEHNPYVGGLNENFSKLFKEMNPDLYVMSGLQMMDHFEYQPNERDQIIRRIKNFAIENRSVKTHFELASFADSELVSELINQVIPFSDSIGCNEQELPNIYSALKFGKITTISASMPKVAEILDTLVETFQLLQTIESDRKPSRIHVHTLAYQAIIQRNDEATDKMWPNIKESAARAAITAIRHVCQDENISDQNSKILLDGSFRRSAKKEPVVRQYVDIREGVTCWSEDNYKICLATGLVCTKVKQTAGGGDNISAAGLAAQLP